MANWWNNDSKDRGLKFFKFKDLYDSECSMSESSLATEAALWLGVSTDYNGKECTHMHLSVSQVKMLINKLQNWVEENEEVPDMHELHNDLTECLNAVFDINGYEWYAKVETYIKEFMEGSDTPWIKTIVTLNESCTEEFIIKLYTDENGIQMFKVTSDGGFEYDDKYVCWTDLNWAAEEQFDLAEKIMEHLDKNFSED